jgi:hypothetical protein
MKIKNTFGIEHEQEYPLVYQFHQEIVHLILLLSIFSN